MMSNSYSLSMNQSNGLSLNRSLEFGSSRLSLFRVSSDDPSCVSSMMDLNLSTSPKMENFHEDNNAQYFQDIPMVTSPLSDYSHSTLGGCIEDDTFEDMELPQKYKDRIKVSESRRNDENSDRNSINDFDTRLDQWLPMGKKMVSNSISGQPPLPTISVNKRQFHEVSSPHGLHSVDIHVSHIHGSSQNNSHPMVPSPHPFQPASYPQLKALSSPVFKVFNQQPLRYFHSAAGANSSQRRRDLKSESLEASVEGLREICLSSMPRTSGWPIKSHSAQSADSVESQTSASLQAIHVFHNMNTMQQRLGVPHVTGHLGSQNGILSNYYYYQNNPTVSLSNSNNEIIGQAQVTATKEEESRPTSSKTASMAQNVAAAGANHLCLLYEVCIGQYEEIAGILNSFQPLPSEFQQNQHSLGIALDVNKEGRTQLSNMVHHSMVKVSRSGSRTEKKGVLKLKSYSSLDHQFGTSNPFPIIFNNNSLSNSKSLDSGHLAVGGTTSSSYNDDEYEYDDIFNFEDPSSLNTSIDVENQQDPSVVLMRYLDITSAYSEVLQLQSKEREALNVMLQCFALITTFVARSFPEPPEAMLPGYTKPAKVILEEAPIYALELLINELLCDYNRRTEIHLCIGMPLYHCLDRLAYYTNMHLLYAMTNAIRRFTVLLKWNKMLDNAIIVGRAGISLYQSMANMFEEHRVDLVSAYALLASVLLERGCIQESKSMDSLALELSSQMITSSQIL